MEKLLEGVARFHREEYLPNREFFQNLGSKPQQPTALFITCSDSRINPNLLTQTEPGDLFLIRNAGNLVPPYGAGGGEVATIEYSLEVLGIRDIVICGHSQCGAIQAILENERMAASPALRRWCQHAEATRRVVRRKYAGRPVSEIAALTAMENVLVQMEHLETHPAVAERLSANELHLHGWYYDIGTGAVSQYDRIQDQFQPIHERISSWSSAGVLG